MANLGPLLILVIGFFDGEDTCYFLFDYYNGKIPSLDSSKMLAYLSS